MLSDYLFQLVFRTNRIESNWVRFEFDSIESRIEFERFEFDSDSIRFDSNSRDITQIFKKGNFCFRENWKVHYTRSHKFPKKEICLPIIWPFDSIRFKFDSIWLNSIRIDLNSIRIDLNSIRIRSIRIQFDESFAEP